MTAVLLPISIALAVCAVFSLSVLTFNWFRSAEPKIQLPLHDRGGDLSFKEHDPFDVVEPEDIIEGYPVELEKFLKKIRLWKIGIAILGTVLLILEAISFGTACLLGSSTDIIPYALLVLFNIYALILVVYLIPEQDVIQNRVMILHVASLMSLASLLLFISAILPATPLPVKLYSLGLNQTVPVSLRLTSLCLYILVAMNLVLIPHGPQLHYPTEQIYSPKVVESITNQDEVNVTGITWCSIMDYLLFSYTSKVVALGNTAESLEIGDLPITPASIRATFNYSRMVGSLRVNAGWKIRSWKPSPGSGIGLGWCLIRCNTPMLLAEIVLAAVAGVIFYAPAIFMREIIHYIEADPERRDPAWGWVFVAGVFLSNILMFLVTAQLRSVATTILAVSIKTQLNSILFKKTLTRKDVAGASSSSDGEDKVDDPPKDEGDGFATKGQIFTLFTTDADRVADFSWHLFTLVDAPIEIVVGTVFLYKLLGVSSLVGLAVTCLFLPLNHWAGKVVAGAQDNMMKKRDERVALMNEVLGAIRMLKFMAWERSFEARILKIRDQELKWQRLNYFIETIFIFVWYTSPVLVTLVSFWHYAIYRGQPLTPAVAFPSILVFTQLKFALVALPETFIAMLQGWVSLKRIDKYLSSLDVSVVPPLEEQSSSVAFQSSTVTWPQYRRVNSPTPSLTSTPRQKFSLFDLNLTFPLGELSLICGKLGSGKTLLLLSLLGESDVLAGQVLCPRSPPDSLAKLAKKIAPDEDWIVKGVCAYVPQTTWLRNASIKDNILFNLPYDDNRYQKTLAACALLVDLEIIEDGDEAEIGERGVNLSGGQKARVSLARAVYSRASIVLLDDVLSAVDAHTAHHLYHECLKGDLMIGRTVLLVSHHVQLCAPGAGYVVALDNGQTTFAGDSRSFMRSSVLSTLIQSRAIDVEEEKEEVRLDSIPQEANQIVLSSEASSTTLPAKEKKPPRKLISEELRAVGHIQSTIYKLYLGSYGGILFWVLFAIVFLVATLVPVADNGWLRYWSDSVLSGANDAHGTWFYIQIYAAITLIGALIRSSRYLVLYSGSISASVKLYKLLLNGVLFTTMRFHDTVSRGRLLNRFGKDFEGIDSSLSDNLGRTFIAVLNVATTIVTISVVGGPLFIIAILFLGLIYWHVGKAYGQASRDMRRLDSVTRSPLYSLYGETIAGVAILRAFGAPSKFLRDMLLAVDTNLTPYYWMWGVNRWVSIRFNLISAVVCGVTAAVCLINKRVDSAFAGLALAFASSIVNDILTTVRRFVMMEQSMVALERVKEYSDLPTEGPEFIEPRPEASWPHSGRIICENLVVKYAPDLPTVLHDLSFDIQAGERIGLLGRTGSGKSTLALSLFRFFEATKGRILIDGKDISEIGLTDLRGRLTIIPQDPSILSGSIRSALDVFDEYDDADIFEALRRVHLLPSATAPSSLIPASVTPDQEEGEGVNANVFRNLEAPVSEGGDNFSTGEKQLICMARAVLRRTKILVMDEATASVDYATDELISQTIRQEFSDSTILTIAHRLRTVIDYDRVMLLDQGRIVEFDKPSVLLKDTSSQFYHLCKATGKDEFSVLKRMAGI